MQHARLEPLSAEDAAAAGCTPDRGSYEALLQFGTPPQHHCKRARLNA